MKFSERWVNVVGTNPVVAIVRGKKLQGSSLLLRLIVYVVEYC